MASSVMLTLRYVDSSLFPFRCSRFLSDPSLVSSLIPFALSWCLLWVFFIFCSLFLDLSWSFLRFIVKSSLVFVGVLCDIFGFHRISFRFRLIPYSMLFFPSVVLGFVREISGFLSFMFPRFRGLFACMWCSLCFCQISLHALFDWFLFALTVYSVTALKECFLRGPQQGFGGGAPWAPGLQGGLL